MGQKGKLFFRREKKYRRNDESSKSAFDNCNSSDCFRQESIDVKIGESLMRNRVFI